MIVVGLTGKYCSGKDTIAGILKQYDFQEIDVDAVGHEALVSEREAITGRFGTGIQAEDGSVDRRELGKLVFSDPSLLGELEAIVHPVMVKSVEGRIARLASLQPAPAGVVINAAILCRMGLSRLCDMIVFVEAPLLTRFARARRRDSAGLLSVLRRLSAQRDLTPQYCDSDADIKRVRNVGGIKGLRAKLRSILPLP